MSALLFTEPIVPWTKTSDGERGGDPWWWLRKPAGRPGSAAVVQINLIWIKRRRLSARLLDATLMVLMEKRGGGIIEAKLKPKKKKPTLSHGAGFSSHPADFCHILMLANKNMNNPAAKWFKATKAFLMNT